VTADAVRLAQAGDRRAFQELVENRLGRLYATAALVLHDRTLAEDAVQEALVRAWRSLPRLREPERFDGWLRSVLVHACLDAARNAKHHRSDVALAEDLRADSAFETSVADRDEVERAFMTLPVHQRAAFVLRHYLGYSVQEVSDTLRIPLGTAKSRLHHAERAMAAAIEAAEPLPEGGIA
jgi:RNA polymerase sigma-70 factor (ECF subfamily)